MLTTAPAVRPCSTARRPRTPWVAGVYNETVQLVTGSLHHMPEDLKGKTVCVGDVGSGTALNAAQVLEAYDMTFDDIKVMYDSFLRRR